MKNNRKWKMCNIHIQYRKVLHTTYLSFSSTDKLQILFPCNEIHK